LSFQRNTIEEYATRSGITVLEYFGGTYESAKSDGGKEFMRMLEFIKKNKGKISHLLVYTLDRFSRTGRAALKIAQDLRENMVLVYLPLLSLPILPIHVEYYTKTCIYCLVNLITSYAVKGQSPE
jgi:DNA invertase Pin-like site-specific DNA recombinase